MTKVVLTLFSPFISYGFCGDISPSSFDLGMIRDCQEVFERVLEVNKSKLLECSGEPDHLHLLLDIHPNNNISALIGSLKSASSRVIRRKYPSEISGFYWGKSAKLWHDSKCIVSCGGASLETVKRYIQEQSGGRE